MTCNSFTGGTGTGTRQVISIFHVKYLLCLSNGLFGLFKSVNRSIAVVRDVSSYQWGKKVKILEAGAGASGWAFTSFILQVKVKNKFQHVKFNTEIRIDRRWK